MQYVLTNKNTPILICEIDETSNAIIKITDMLNPEYLPIGINPKKEYLRKELNDWWRERSIPASRQGLQEALLNMGIANKDYLLTKGLGLSLSDQYWINPQGQLDWNTVNFFDNSFSYEVGDILFGERTNYKELNLMSPDNTSDGWLKKRWKIINDERCLIKGGSTNSMQEPINEAFVSEVINAMDFKNFVPYELNIVDEVPYSVCKNFITKDTELVTAYQILQTSPKPNDVAWKTHFLNCCDKLQIPEAKENLDFMLALDYLIRNTDRHTTNFGAIRDINTLKFVGMAPVFDSGTSLWHDVSTEVISPFNKFKTRPFHEDPKKQLKLISSFDNFDLTKLKNISSKFNDLLIQSPTISAIRRERLCNSFDKHKDNFLNLINNMAI